MNQEIYDVVVAGAGVVGCSITYHLARAGLKVALLDKGAISEESSLAGAGLLAPLAEAAGLSAIQNPFALLCLAGLKAYSGLDLQLKAETGIDIELVNAPALRPAFTEEEANELKTALAAQKHLLPGLEWLDARTVREAEPLLAENVLGALISPSERNVQSPRLAAAYARGASARGAQIFEGRAMTSLLKQGNRVTGVQTSRGPVQAGAVVLATGAWSNQWHNPTAGPAIFPVKGQMVSLAPRPGFNLKHGLYYHKLGYMLPKANGTIFVGGTAENAGFEKTVSPRGLIEMLGVISRLTPHLIDAPFERAWAGLRPASADGLPLLGASKTATGLWVATGHFRNGILLAPLTGAIITRLIQEETIPGNLDLTPFDPDRFGGWA